MVSTGVSAAEAPSALLGRWLLEGRTDCANPRDTLVFERDAVVLGNEVHGPLRIVRIGPDRWYVDAPDGSEGARVMLDVNAVADGRLLIARRPLGEAVFATLCAR